MTASFMVLCASGSVIFGLLFGRLYAWWLEVRDEEQAMADANIRARFDAQRFDIVDPGEPYTPATRPVPFYDWSVEL